MKKFLTVLLVIAVMFTFSFGSAFAALSSDQVDALNTYKAQQAQNYYGTIEQAGVTYLNGLTFDANGYLTKSAGVSVGVGYEGLVSKDIVKAAVDAAVNDAKTAFGTAVATIVPSDVISTESAILDELQKAYVNVTTGGSGKITDTNILGANLANVLDDQLKVDKDAAAAELAAYDPNLYSNDISEYAIEFTGSNDVATGCGYTYSDATGLSGAQKLTAKEFVTKVKATQTAEATTPTGADDATKIQAVRKARRIAKEMILGHKITTSENYYIAPIKTLDDLKADTSVDAAKANAITQLKAALASKQIEMANAIQDGIDKLSQYASLSDDNKKLLSDLNEAKADLAEQFADVEEVWTAQLNYKETTVAVRSARDLMLSVIGRFGNGGNGMPNADATSTFNTCADRVAAVDKLEADAAILALQKDVNGQPYYDADVLKANLAKAIKTVYVDGTSYADAAKLLAGGNEAALVNAKIDYTNFITGEATSLQPKDSKGKTVTAKWNKVWTLASADAKGKVAILAKGENNGGTGYDANPTYMYDKAQRTALSDLVDETKAAIKDAASIAEIEKIFAEAHDKYEAISTTKDHKDSWAATGSVGLAYNKAGYDQELLAYATYFVNKVESSKYPAEVNSAAKVMDAVVYPIIYKAYTADELAEKVAEAKAAVDAIKTTADVRAERTAVENAIKALPATITLADEDAIMAAQDMLWDYEDIPGSASNPVTNKPVLVAAENAYEKLAAKELDAAYKALASKKTITTADAEAIEALRDLFDSYDAFCEDYFSGVQSATTTEAKVIELEDKLSDAKVAAVRELMIKLPANPTAKDRAQVEAARAAYEALSLDEQAQIVGTLPWRNLIDAEEALGVLNVYAVQALKIKASSTVKKGSITVKWTVKGDAAAADGYQIWKSTKKSSGYKKAFTTTKKSYKNTKGLKKGTRYYYKVRAYKVVDGKNVYSDWSNKAYRIAK